MPRGSWPDGHGPERLQIAVGTFGILALELGLIRWFSGQIRIFTAADGKVTLWGAVASDAERRRAAQLAGKVDGVSNVDNQLKVVKGS